MLRHMPCMLSSADTTENTTSDLPGFPSPILMAVPAQRWHSVLARYSVSRKARSCTLGCFASMELGVLSLQSTWMQERTKMVMWRGYQFLVERIVRTSSPGFEIPGSTIPFPYLIL